MKKILISTIVLIAMVSCKRADDTNHVYEQQLQQTQEVQQQAPLIPQTYVCDFPYSKNIDEINVVQIGDCEYLVAHALEQKDITITHKGDCKFCMQRQEDMIRRILAEKNH
jgi:hypothetical protein